MKKKKFFITIDTEGDNLWDWHKGMPIKTENTLFLQRFQDLANKYGFKPTWLTNYEMIMDNRYVKFIKKVLAYNSGELGMHLHAWNTPPDYDITIVENGQPYLIEYPTEIMEEKIKTMTETIKERTGITPVSHRSGRWAMDDRYFGLLAKYGYKIDCSVTPHIDWSGALGWSKNFGGSDYSKYDEKAYVDKSGIMEVPMTVRLMDKFIMPDKITPRRLAGALKRKLNKTPIWLRPNGNNLNQMKYIVNKAMEEDSDYLMFMLHSSEMMPGGSPTFRDEESIEKMYKDVEVIFQMAEKQFIGSLLLEYRHRR